MQQHHVGNPSVNTLEPCKDYVFPLETNKNTKDLFFWTFLSFSFCQYKLNTSVWKDFFSWSLDVLFWRLQTQTLKIHFLCQFKLFALINSSSLIQKYNLLKWLVILKIETKVKWRNPSPCYHGNLPSPLVCLRCLSMQWWLDNVLDYGLLYIHMIFKESKSFIKNLSFDTFNHHKTYLLSKVIN